MKVGQVAAFLKILPCLLRVMPNETALLVFLLDVGCEHTTALQLHRRKLYWSIGFFGCGNPTGNPSGFKRSKKPFGG